MIKYFPLEKNCCPDFKDIIQRTEKFKAVDSASKRRVVWVTGPAGSGKTTLISSYLKNRNLPFSWYRIDESDVDISSFQNRLTATFLHSFTEDTMTEEFNGKETKLSFDINTINLHKIMPLESSIILDNYQKLPKKNSFHLNFRNFLSKIPQGITVFIISRNAPHSSFARMMVQHDVSVIDWKILKLDLQETEEIIKCHLSSNVSEKVINNLHELTQGWAAGLTLMLLKMRLEDYKIEHLCHSYIEEIHDYFYSEVYEALGEKKQSLLLKTALLPEVSEENARILSGFPNADRMLIKLSRNNCFIEKNQTKKAFYSYHPLFKKFLVAVVKEALPDDDLYRLHQETASIYEKKGNISEAISVLLKIGDWTGTSYFIEQYAPNFITAGSHKLLNEWIDSLPSKFVKQSPWLIYWKGENYLVENPSKSQLFFEMAFAEFRDQNKAEGSFLSWAGIINAIEWGYESFAPFDKWIEVLDQMLLDYNGFPCKKIEAHVTASMLAALALRQPNHSDINDWIQRGFQAVESDAADDNLKIKILAYIAYFQIQIGDFESAGFLINLLRKLADNNEISLYARLISGYIDALYHQLTGFHDKCLETVSHSLEISETHGYNVMNFMLSDQAVSSALNVSDYSKAEELLEKTTDSIDSEKSWLLSNYHFLKTRHELHQHNPQNAYLHIEIAIKSAKKSGSPFILGLCYLARAYVLHELGRHDEGPDFLDKAFLIAEQINSKLLDFYASWTEALFAIEHGDEISGIKLLKRALALKRKNGYMYACIDIPKTTAKLCEKALGNDIEVGYIQETIKKRNLLPHSAPVHLENWPWKIKIFTLGRFSLVRDNAAIKMNKKAQQKPLSMLKALIAFGGREVREDQIADVLWPDADGDIAHKAFATTLHRLRKLLGHHDIVSLSNGCVSLNSRYCWVDVWHFERAVGAAEASWRSDNNSKMRNDTVPVDLTEKAIRLYRGKFLSEEAESAWVFYLQEKLQSKFHRAVIKIGKHFESIDDLQKAIEFYQYGLEIDGLAEELYQRLMKCYKKLGRRAEALTVYERCKRILEATLSIEPSSETKKINRTIIASEPAR